MFINLHKSSSAIKLMKLAHTSLRNWLFCSVKHWFQKNNQMKNQLHRDHLSQQTLLWCIIRAQKVFIDFYFQGSHSCEVKFSFSVFCLWVVMQLSFYYEMTVKKSHSLLDQTNVVYLL